MKIALLLSGALRNFEDTYDSIKFHILDKFVNVDVFIYCVENVIGKEKNLVSLQQMFNPKRLIINEPQFYNNINGSILFGDIHSPYNNFWSNSIRAFYNVKQVNLLKKEFEVSNGFEYDLVIRTRFDLFWIRSISNDELDRISNNQILIPYDWAFRKNHPSKGPNDFGFSDLYSISSSKNMDFYSNAFDFIATFSSSYSYHPESLLGKYLENKSVYESTRHVITDYPTKTEPFGPIGLFASDMISVVEKNNLCLEDHEFYSPKTWEHQLDRKRFDKK